MLRMCSIKALKTGGHLKIPDFHSVTCVNSVDYHELQREPGEGPDPLLASKNGSRMSSVVEMILRKAGEFMFPGMDSVPIRCEIQLTSARLGVGRQHPCI
jgi:hypothetical protein